MTAPAPDRQRFMRQAWALSYALRTRPTRALAARYFDALKRVLDSPPDMRARR